MLPSDIEGIIQRDLDRLPVLPPERWTPRAPQLPIVVLLRRVASVATVVVVVASVAFGLAYARELAGSVASASLTPAPGLTPLESLVTRQSVIAYVRGLTTMVPRVARVEAKLVSAEDVAAVSGVMKPPQGRLFWLVAVSGDVHCSFCVLPPSRPLRSATFWFDAVSGDPLASSQGADVWPAGFDSLPDRAVATGSRTLTGGIVSAADGVLVFAPAASPDRLRLRADENTAFGWVTASGRGDAFSLDELLGLNLPRNPARAMFDPVPRVDGSYRLESLVLGPSGR